MVQPVEAVYDSDILVVSKVFVKLDKNEQNFLGKSGIWAQDILITFQVL